MLFFELLRYSLGIDSLPPVVTDSDWGEMHQLAREQSLLGVIYKAVERMPKQNRPPKHLLLQWFVESERIRQQNEKVYEACAVVTDLFESAGVGCCVLKGQGNAMMYENPYIRMSGDIDLWADPSKIKFEGGFLILGDKRLKAGTRVYHHVDVEDVHGVSLEVHTRPSFMNNLIHNKRMQAYFSSNASSQFANKVEMPDGKGRMSIPTARFNMIYQLAHISKHFFQDGIGLRHFVDYYYVLRNSSETDRQGVADVLKSLGLYKLAQAVMYVEHQVLALDEKYFIVPESEKYGQFLLSEIMQSGNFGRFDKRVDDFHRRTAIGRNLERLRRDARLMWLFPSEALWEPVFRVWHYFWRLKNA